MLWGWRETSSPICYILGGVVMTRDRKLLAQLLKNWAQDHNHGFQINDPDPGDQGVANTGGYELEIIDYGHTVKLGGYEASTRSILVDLDPEYKEYCRSIRRTDIN